MAPQPTGLTRSASRIATGTSWARNVSTWGPPGTSVHSVSRGGTTVGRSMTSTIGLAWPAATCCCTTCG